MAVAISFALGLLAGLLSGLGLALALAVAVVKRYRHDRASELAQLVDVMSHQSNSDTRSASVH